MMNGLSEYISMCVFLKKQNKIMTKDLNTIINTINTYNKFKVRFIKFLLAKVIHHFFDQSPSL